MHSKQLASTFAIAVTIVGCGGSSSNSSTNPFAGTYTGNMTLDSSKNGALSLTVASSGAATGTLVVNAPSSAPTRGGGGFTFTVGTTNISGTVGSDGTLNITGTDAGSGLFTVGGQIGASGGNININAGGQTFTGTLSASTGGGSITLTNGSGSNAIMSNFPANPLVFMSTIGGASSIVASPPGGGNARTLTLLLDAAAIAGSNVTYTGNPIDPNSFQYVESATKSWKATAGTASIVSRTSSTIQITFNNVTMTSVEGTGATGTFTINGTLTK